MYWKDRGMDRRLEKLLSVQSKVLSTVEGKEKLKDLMTDLQKAALKKIGLAMMS